ncbi:MAG: hypothetical protein WCX82_04710 [archaeon]|jgi:hypothetical protein
MPKRKNPITPLPEKNKLIFTKLIPTIRKVQKLKNEQEIIQKTSQLNAARLEIRNYTKNIYSNLESRQELEGLNQKTRKQVFGFIESKIAESYLKGINRKMEMDIQVLASGLIQEIKNRLEKPKVKREIISKIKYYKYLTQKEKQKINEIINYNLALISKYPTLTLEQVTDLNKKIFKMLSKMQFSFSKIK